MNVRDALEALRSVASIELFVLGGTSVQVSSVVTLVLIVLATYWISRLAQRIVGRAMLATGMDEAGTSATIRRLMHYAIMVVGIGIGLQTIGISVTSLFAAGAFLAVGIGFALQTILENFASGVILLGERSIEEGDVLEIDGTMVKVERIGTRSTVARTRDDDQLIIPNSALVQGTVVNHTLGDSVYRIRAQVGVAYESDMHVVEEALKEACLSIPQRKADKDPVFFLLSFGDSSVLWEASIWAEDPWEQRVTRSDLNKAIWWSLKKHGVSIAFPQIDVHMIPRPES